MRRLHLASGLGLLLFSGLGFKCPGERPRFVEPSAAGGARGDGGSGGDVGEGGDIGQGGEGGDIGQGGIGGEGGIGGQGGSPCVPVGVELPTAMGDTPVDEDCDGQIDEPPDTCDASIAELSTDPLDAARALELCSPAVGFLDARWTRSNGANLQDPGLTVKLATVFGANIQPQRGDKMLVMSTGRARDVNDADNCDPGVVMECSELGQGTAPPGFPSGALGCPPGTDVRDDVALEVDLEAPPNVDGFSFRTAFASLEFPESVCTPFNDQFLTLMIPPPIGAIDGNVVFDSFGTPPSSLFDPIPHCDPNLSGEYAAQCMETTCPSAPMPYCDLGPAFLEDTGFDVWKGTPSGSTGWVETVVPASPGQQFTLRFTVYDASDAIVDSTSWIDGFEWRAGVTAIGTTVVP